MSTCIDWHSQWEQHAPNFQDGYAHINLGSQCKLLLTPGPGFGDFSHPTTQLMLEYLRKESMTRCFVDIGSGSGILSLAAASLGSQEVHGIEIDPEAIEHACLNGKINGLKVDFYQPHLFKANLTAPLTIAMNMIRTEQKTAWASLPSLHRLQGNIFTSGVLEEEQELYLNQTKEWGWTLISTRSLQGWLAFHFISHIYSCHKGSRNPF